jgi:ribosomal protein S18 acetylase RimI-like enzyme
MLTVTVAGPADAERIAGFVGGLSVRTQFQRFFASVARPSASLLRALAGGSGQSDVLLVTVTGGGGGPDGLGGLGGPGGPDGAGGAVIGHAMAVDRIRADGSRAADLGLVVADAWQGRGVGSALLAGLTRRARARGVAELTLDVLRSNDRMLAMIERRWPGAPRTYDGGSVIIRVPLPPAGPGSLHPLRPGVEGVDDVGVLGVYHPSLELEGRR